MMFSWFFSLNPPLSCRPRTFRSVRKPPPSLVLHRSFPSKSSRLPEFVLQSEPAKMLLSRILSRSSRSASRTASLLLPSPPPPGTRPPPLVSDQCRPLACGPPSKYGISSSASPENIERVSNSEATKASGNAENSNGSGDRSAGESKVSGETETSGTRLEAAREPNKTRRKAAKRTAFSDSESEGEKELSMDDLAKLVAEKEELLKLKHKEIEGMQDKVLRSYAEMENVMDRTRREAENSKKYAVQNFAKNLLDVADNLGRASSVVKESFSKIDAKDGDGAVPLLRTLLEGVDMTEKQLVEVFKKHGIEKYDPTNEPIDPHRHNAVFQMPDSSKPPGTVAAVLKAGYMLYDRVLRPAEVGVTQAEENDATAEKGS
ncbi:grpE protein homolog 2, mitochondrial-like isoform X2 [Syzygium oleosum]|uniref:grpE protein homolog 2, mitochondrial-like isoform X2 n=1 Tax=Syzygium oleosum TaxID=219896 RepID=UPI0024B97F54|nr:grpE protein homolog 2, mitochondrial-like isoform X2 [Syzygium oleosum]